MTDYYISETVDTHTLEIDTLKGLSSTPKFLLSKYFYDDKGSSIFREITKMPEYYLTRSEQEILENQKERITDSFLSANSPFDLIEPGSGDGSKTKILLELLVQKKTDFRYIPVDISPEANRELVSVLNMEMPSLRINTLTGDFFRLTGNAIGSSRRKVILFLGSNIGNFTEPEINLFLLRLSALCRKDDLLMIGFDLKKSPGIIMKAYDDPYGLTKSFNLNHLARLNRELDADFNTDMFEHHTSYDPVAGELKSYLVSKEDQTVHIGSFAKEFSFARWEPIFMELSRKFDFPFIERIAHSHGFSIVNHFTDEKTWFTDSLWMKK